MIQMIHVKTERDGQFVGTDYLKIIVGSIEYKITEDRESGIVINKNDPDDTDNISVMPQYSNQIRIV